MMMFLIYFLTSNNISKNFKKISVNSLIFFIKFLIFLKRLLAAFFTNLVYKPGLVVARFLFYKVLIKLYQLYFRIIKRLGWTGRLKNKSAAFFLSQKLVHVIVGFSTLLFVVFNLTQKTQAVSPEELTGRTFLSEIISSEFGETDQLIEEYFDEEAEITPVQQTYLDNLTAVRVQPTAEMSPEESTLEETQSNVQSGSALVKPGLAATSRGIRPREGIINYTVLAGDTVSTIAAQFGVSVNTILWENSLSAYSLIRPGNKLAILPVSGISLTVKRGDTIASISARYGIEANAILEMNKLASAEMLTVGKKIIIPGGRQIYAAATQVARNTAGASITDLFKPENLKSIISNKLAWPTVGARITQYYSWRHHAVDIANKKGTPIYACDAGVIEVAGWGTGYGNQIVVDHGGGRKSRYGHLSKFYVKKGQVVAKGEAIAAMGSTGNSTGPHLHLEYVINGVKYNPLNYLK
ncbi:MAG: peptidoglycan DD-metalloendopeptidase family protein [Patescibacteria group bacterium]|nr:peptidoglycan DD-metalloendopeptidase family protein [Patescibacteria group bacterium]